MSKPTQPITLYAKTDNTFIIKSYVDTQKTIPFDYTGYTFESGVKLKSTDKIYLVEFTVTTVPSTEFSSTNHCIKFHLSKESSVVLNGKIKGVWDFHAIPPSGDSYRPYAPSLVTIVDGVSEIG